MAFLSQLLMCHLRMKGTLGCVCALVRGFGCLCGCACACLSGCACLGMSVCVSGCLLVSYVYVIALSNNVIFFLLYFMMLIKEKTN